MIFFYVKFKKRSRTHFPRVKFELCYVLNSRKKEFLIGKMGREGQSNERVPLC